MNSKNSNSIYTIETIKAYIDYNYTEKLSIMELADKFNAILVGFSFVRYYQSCSIINRFMDILLFRLIMAKCTG